MYISVELGGCIKARVFDLTPPCVLQDTEQAPDFTHVPDVFRVFMFRFSLTEKILTEFLFSSSQMNLALRLVRRSSSIRGGFTNTTYGLNSNVYTCLIFCGDEDRKKGGHMKAEVRFYVIISCLNTITRKKNMNSEERSIGSVQIQIIIIAPLRSKHGVNVLALFQM